MSNALEQLALALHELRLGLTEQPIFLTGLALLGCAAIIVVLVKAHPKGERLPPALLVISYFFIAATLVEGGWGIVQQ